MAGEKNAYSDIARFAEEHKAQGKKIVFTNGCFDLLHPGHIDILKRARSLGDALIVGLNSDDSVRRLKGESRPLIPETLRRQSLEELRCVDAVAIFTEDTPVELIMAIKPDVLVKGSQYELEKIVGADTVKEVYRAPMVDGVSTTALIGR